MKFAMWDHDGGNDFELIGSAEITIQELKESAASGEEFPFVAELKHEDKPDSRRGDIKIFVTIL